MKLTLVLSDFRWLAELRDRQLRGRGGVQIPEIDKRKLLAMGLIEEKTGGLVLIRPHRAALACHLGFHSLASLCASAMHFQRSRYAIRPDE